MSTIQIPDDGALILLQLKSALPNGCGFENRGKAFWTLDIKKSLPLEFSIHSDLRHFYSSDRMNEKGLPLAGALQTDSEFNGNEMLSLFDIRIDGVGTGLRIIPENPEQSWIIKCVADKLELVLTGKGVWQILTYKGNEPDWSVHEFPFSNLPKSDSITHHAFVRGLLDFFSGTRRSGQGTFYHMPNTNGGYDGDGIPDTYFQFMATYKYLSEIRRSYWHSHLEWLGDHMRPDGGIPWGGVNCDKPYYHLWINEKYGLFFDGNGLWLEMIYRLWIWGAVVPDLEKVIRAADFYLHYMTPDGLVAAESKKAGCEWADFLKNGWHSSLINVLTYRGLLVAALMLEASGMKELAARYQMHADRLKSKFNQHVSDGGLWNGEGYADWRDKDGKLHMHWRIDTHMLAIIFGVPSAEQKEIILRKIEKDYFEKEPAVPAPYILNGSWLEPEDDMLEGRRSFGCGKTSWMGRCGAPLAAVLFRSGKTDLGDRIFKKLVKMVSEDSAIYESYEESGEGIRVKSYIEHSLSPLYAVALKDFE